jgi:hypothetical protein
MLLLGKPEEKRRKQKRRAGASSFIETLIHVTEHNRNP